MEQRIFVESEDKTSKNGKRYTRFKDEKGAWISCFEKDITDALQEHFNEMVNVEIAEVGNFKNIRSFHGAVQEKMTPQTTLVLPVEVAKANIPQAKAKDESVRASMLLSYAKDLSIAFKTDLHENVQLIHAEYKKLKTQLEND